MEVGGVQRGLLKGQWRSPPGTTDGVFLKQVQGRVEWQGAQLLLNMVLGDLSPVVMHSSAAAASGGAAAAADAAQEHRDDSVEFIEHSTAHGTKNQDKQEHLTNLSELLL